MEWGHSIVFCSLGMEATLNRGGGGGGGSASGLRVVDNPLAGANPGPSPALTAGQWVGSLFMLHSEATLQSPKIKGPTLPKLPRAGFDFILKGLRAGHQTHFLPWRALTMLLLSPRKWRAILTWLVELAAVGCHIAMTPSLLDDGHRGLPVLTEREYAIGEGAT